MRKRQPKERDCGICKGRDAVQNYKEEIGTEKNQEKIEKRIAFVTSEIGWVQEKEGREGLKCIGALHTEFETKGRPE